MGQKNKLNKLFFRILNYLKRSISARKEYSTKKELMKYLPKNPIIIDAGAHLGEDTIEFSKIWPKSKIYAFEPSPKVFYELKKRTKKYKNINAINSALGEKNCKLKFYESSPNNDAAGSLKKPAEVRKFFPDIKFKNNTIVDVVNLDSWVEKRNIQKIDFLWLDLQGSEYDVLSSSPKTLSNASVIHIEILYKKLYSNCPINKDIEVLLKKNGFIKIKEVKSHETFGNAIFVKKQLLQK